MNEVNSGLLALAAKAGHLASEAVQEDKVADRLARARGEYRLCSTLGQTQA